MNPHLEIQVVISTTWNCSYKYSKQLVKVGVLSGKRFLTAAWKEALHVNKVIYRPSAFTPSRWTLSIFWWRLCLNNALIIYLCLHCLILRHNVHIIFLNKALYAFKSVCFSFLVFHHTLWLTSSSLTGQKITQDKTSYVFVTNLLLRYSVIFFSSSLFSFFYRTYLVFFLLISLFSS